MKLRRFVGLGAVVMAALTLVPLAAAQGLSQGNLSGSLDLEPGLGGALLFSDIAPGNESSGNQNIVDIGQFGSGNSAKVNQTNSAYGALASVAQFGADNTVDIIQCACGNVVDVIQDGSANLSEITQTGAGNVFVHRQYGDTLSLSVAQYGGAQIAITQTGP